MTESFYGPWSVTVLSKEAFFDQRFIVTGSANADGIYPGVPGTGPGPVTGTVWTIACEWNDNAGSGWQPSGVKRFARYTVAEGLVVELGADDNVEAARDYDYNDMVLACISQDPDLTPLHPVPPFYDFTVPQDIVDKNPHDFPDRGDDKPVDEPRRDDQQRRPRQPDTPTGDPLRPGTPTGSVEPPTD
jgi:hypothetical protein